MYTLDGLVLAFVNQFAQKWPAFDTIVRSLSTNHLLKGGVLVALLWWAWFECESWDPGIARDHRAKTRAITMTTMFSCAVAETVARILSLTLPFRPRPIYEPSIHFTLPYGLDPSVIGLSMESSFPSDHAVLFFSLSANLYLISRRVGWLSFGYTILLIALPRIYLGFHYFSDIIGGAAIGIGIAMICYRIINTRLLKTVTDFSYKSPQFFYPAFFLFTMQLSQMFDDSRSIIHGLGRMMKGLA